MKLYSYFRSSAAYRTRIALNLKSLSYESVPVHLIKEGGQHRKLEYRAINPQMKVPALTLDNGEVLTENVAVLQYIADRSPAAKLAPAAGTMERYRLMEWLSFINSEVHKAFSPLFREDAPEDTKQYTRKNLAIRLDYLERVLGSKTFLMGEQFTIADGYLFTVLSWGQHVNLDIGKWPQLKRFVERVGARPHVIEALKAEGQKK